jgi:hypothetical protein
MVLTLKVAMSRPKMSGLEFHAVFLSPLRSNLWHRPEPHQMQVLVLRGTDSHPTLHDYRFHPYLQVLPDLGVFEPTDRKGPCRMRMLSDIGCNFDSAGAGTLSRAECP